MTTRFVCEAQLPVTQVQRKRSRSLPVIFYLGGRGALQPTHLTGPDIDEINKFVNCVQSHASGANGFGHAH